MRNKIILSDGVTELTKIKNFRYTSQVGFDNAQFRYGSVCSSTIEFDYYLTGNSVLNSGDTIEYYQTIDIDKYLEPLPNSGTNDVYISRFFVKSAETEKITCHVVAYDATIKLDTNYSIRLKELSGNFPATGYDLLVDVASYCGLTFYPPEHDPDAPLTLFELPISEFYLADVSCRDLFAWAAELEGCDVYVTSDPDGDYVYFDTYSPSRGTTRGWLAAFKYIVCPTDQHTYTVVESGVAETKYNVFYKESGFQESPNPQCQYDGVRIVDNDGNIVAQYARYAQPSTFYYINGNPFIGVIQSNSTVLLATARSIEAGLYSLRGYQPTRVKLFPFRNPYIIGSKTYVVDGRLPYAQQVPRLIPINRIVVTESEVTLEAFGVGETDNSYSPYNRSLDNSILSIKEDLNDLVFATLSKSVTISAGTPSSPATVTVTQANFKPSGTDYFCLVGARINQFPLPYISASAGGIGGTYIEQVSFSGNDLTITLKNLIGAWGSGYYLYAVFAFKKT